MSHKGKALERKMGAGNVAMKRYKDNSPHDFAVNRSRKKHNYKMQHAENESERGEHNKFLSSAGGKPMGKKSFLAMKIKQNKKR